MNLKSPAFCNWSHGESMLSDAGVATCYGESQGDEREREHWFVTLAFPNGARPEMRQQACIHMPFQDVGYTAKNDLAEVYKTRFLQCFGVTKHRQKLWKGLHWLHPKMSGLPTASTPTTLPQTWNPSSWTTTRHWWGAACDLTVDPVFVAGKFWQHSSVHWWISLHLCGHQEGLGGEWIVRKPSIGQGFIIKRGHLSIQKKYEKVWKSWIPNVRTK